MQDKPKLDRKNFMFVDTSDAVLVKKPGEVFGKNFKMKNLKNCKVYLLDYNAGMFIDDCEDCTFVIGPSNGSVFIRTSKNCIVHIVSKQLRFRDCYDIKVFGYVPADPVIESSDRFYFAPYCFSFPQLKKLLIEAKINPNENKIEKVYDFCPEEGQTHWDWISQGEVLNIEEANTEELGLQEFGENELLYDGYEEEVKEKYSVELILTKKENKVNEKEENEDKLKEIEEKDNVIVEHSSVNNDILSNDDKNKIDELDFFNTQKEDKNKQQVEDLDFFNTKKEDDLLSINDIDDKEKNVTNIKDIEKAEEGLENRDVNDNYHEKYNIENNNTADDVDFNNFNNNNTHEKNEYSEISNNNNDIIGEDNFKQAYTNEDKSIKGEDKINSNDNNDYYDNTKNQNNDVFDETDNYMNSTVKFKDISLEEKQSDRTNSFFYHQEQNSMKVAKNQSTYTNLSTSDKNFSPYLPKTGENKLTSNNQSSDYLNSNVLENPDNEEEMEILQRLRNEEEKRLRINQEKINNEIKGKKDIRKKAIDYIKNWEE